MKYQLNYLFDMPDNDSQSSNDDNSTTYTENHGTKSDGDSGE